MGQVTIVLVALWIWEIQCQEASGDKQAIVVDDTSKHMKNIIDSNDKFVRPNQGGPAVTVMSNLDVTSLSSVDEVNMQFDVGFFLRQSWVDSRARHEAEGPLIIREENLNSIWKPDIFISNEKSGPATLHLFPNDMMKVYPNGTIVYSMRVLLTLSCPMELTAFPFDRQKCDIKLESYSYEAHDLLLIWDEVKPIDISDDVYLPQYNLINFEVRTVCSRNYRNGIYECLRATFFLERLYGFYLLQDYIPSIFIVILSWLSFWISPEAVPARISLGVTTVLTMATQLSGSKGSNPKVSYPKAIDIWLTACMTFVFSTMVEYAFVSSNIQQRYKESNKEVDSSLNGVEMEPEKPSYVVIRRKSNLQHLDRVDRICRIAFPVVFALFNVGYWVTYCAFDVMHRV